MTKQKLPMLILAFLISCIGSLKAQNNLPKIDALEKVEVVNNLAEIMLENYVFPDKGKEMAELITANLEAGIYDHITDPVEFSKKLSDDMVIVSNDLHINVRYSPQRIEMMRNAEKDASNKELEELQTRLYENSNYGFEEVRILPGNVGYLKFDNFRDTKKAGPIAVSAMNFMANADAVIIDLTENSGGVSSMVQLISTYFLEDSELLNSLYFRKGDKIEQFWTLPHVPGKKLTGTDLYILTSDFTFSAAEAFAYSFQQLDRAMIIGETSGGGAHPVDGFIVNDNFMVRVPFARTINPITSGNWEGTGVVPDIEVAKDEAKNLAYMMALDSLMKKDDHPSILSGRQWVYDGLKAQMEPVAISETVLKKYAGTYGPRKLTLENGSLYYQRDDKPKMKMNPISDVLFAFSEVDYFRLRVIVEDGKAVAVEGFYDNGASDKSIRTN